MPRQHQRSSLIVSGLLPWRDVLICTIGLPAFSPLYPPTPPITIPIIHSLWQSSLGTSYRRRYFTEGSDEFFFGSVDTWPTTLSTLTRMRQNRDSSSAFDVQWFNGLRSKTNPNRSGRIVKTRARSEIQRFSFERWLFKGRFLEDWKFRRR